MTVRIPDRAAKRRSARTPAGLPLARALPRSVERLRVVAISLAIALAVFAQNSGQVAADTKFDLLVDPGRFLQRALTLWDPIGDGGQIQNQAYGYLFPIGPFFVACHWLHLTPWSAQRLWESALLIAAFLGTARVARRLGVAGFWPPIAAGLVYALAPRMLSELTSISAELMPTAALPWILAPLILGAKRGSPRRAAAWSGVALLFAGAVNAAATIAVLPIPAIWLLTRERGARRSALIRWWVLLTAAASAWWVLPLLLAGRYSPPFLDWIENAGTTTSVISQSAAIRGVVHWEAYLGPGIWPAGWILVSAPAAIVATTIVAAGGLFGLAQRETRARLFLVTSLGTGLVLLTIGHAAEIGPPFSGELRHLLDGPLVAFRNLHKFDPVIRLPLAIGVGSGLAALSRRLDRSTRPTDQTRPAVSWRAVVTFAVVAVGAVAITPVLTNKLQSAPRQTVLPSWWTHTGTWLDHHDQARALVVPGSGTPTYIWGATTDDALQPAIDSPWITRSIVPLAQAGTVRLLDAIEQRLAAGDRDPILAALLVRFGIGYVVLRNDLDAGRSYTTSPEIERSTLTASPGFREITHFGPGVGPEVPTPVGKPSRRLPAVEIFQVVPTSGLVDLQPEQQSVVANGSTDELIPLLEQGLPSSTPVFFGTDAPASARPDALKVATDGIRRRQASFSGDITVSQTLDGSQPYVGDRVAYDYLPSNATALSVMTYTGIADVRASSSGADVFATYRQGAASEPWSALDGDPSTAWRSGASGAVGQWIEVDLNSAITVPTITAVFANGVGARPASVAVSTDTETRLDTLNPAAAVQTLAVPAGATKSIRITLTGVLGGGFGTTVGIASLTIPSVHPSRSLMVPNIGKPAIMTFAASDGYRNGCLDRSGELDCDPALVTSGEEDTGIDRTVHLSASDSYAPSTDVVLLGSSALDQRLDADLPYRVSASSVASTDPRQRPGAALDEYASTSWVARPGDRQPSLLVGFKRPQTASELRLFTDPRALIASPTRVRITEGPYSFDRTVPANGVIRLPVTRPVSAVRITILSAQARGERSAADEQTRLLPTGITSLTIGHGPPARSSGTPSDIVFACGSGPQMVIDGRLISLSITAATSDVLAGRPVEATACDPTPLNLGAGTHRIAVAATNWALPRSMTLAAQGRSLTASSPSPGSFAVRHWGASRRSVQVNTTAASLLVVRENYNAGWRASINGRSLRAVRVDGWSQAFVVPANSHGTVVLEFTPQRWFIAGLFVGLLAIVALLAAALLRSRKTDATAAKLAPVRERRPGVGALIGLGAISGLCAGVVGLATFGFVLAALVVLRAAGLAAPRIAIAVAIVVAGVNVATASALDRFDAANSDLSQLLCLAAVVLAMAVGFMPEPRQDRDP